MQAGQGGTTVGQVVAVGVEQPGPEGGQQPRPTVGAGRPAHPDDDLGRAQVERGRHRLTQPAARRRERGRDAARQPPEPARVGHLHHDRPARTSRAHGECRAHRLTGRAVHLHRDRVEPRGQRGGDGALAPVRDRHDHDPCGGCDVEQAQAHGIRHLERGQGPLERIARDDDRRHRPPSHRHHPIRGAGASRAARPGRGSPTRRPPAPCPPLRTPGRATGAWRRCWSRPPR